MKSWTPPLKKSHENRKHIEKPERFTGRLSSSWILLEMLHFWDFHAKLLRGLTNIGVSQRTKMALDMIKMASEQQNQGLLALLLVGGDWLPSIWLIFPEI